MADNPLDQLRAALAEARAIYDEQNQTPDGESGPIAGVVNAVFALDKYLRAVGIEQLHTLPLTDLLGAFRDHSRGKPHPLFEVQRNSGRRGYSTDNAFRAYVAAAVTLSQRAGDSKEVAIKAVAEAADVKLTQVDSWHREISTERHGDNAAIQLYKNMISKADEMFPTDPRCAADTLLAMFGTQTLPSREL